MPTKKKQNQNLDSGDEDYRKKRDRNNQAVKRSRFKSKQKTQETQSRVQELKTKNTVLETKIKTLTKDLKFLKNLFLAQAQTKSENLSDLNLKELLASDDEEELEEDEAD